jgi:uncharacterized protein YfaS (alpha-2-macroglobulin family)
MNNKNTGYDEIKGMLNTIRNLNESRHINKSQINENEEVTNTNADEVNTDVDKEQYDNIEVVNDVEIKLVSTDKEDIELKPEEKNGITQIIDSFRQQVSQIAELDPGFTISEKQVRMDGSITDLEINFVLIAGEEAGLYINSDMLMIENETIQMLEKISKFYPTFVTAMEPLIRDRMSS